MRVPEPAEIDVGVGAGGELADLPTPRGEDLVALAGIRAEPDRAADMVEPDRCLGKAARQVDEFAQLGVIHPGVKAEAERRAKPSSTLESISRPTGRMIADPQAAWSGCEAVMKRMPRKRPPAAIIASSTRSMSFI